MGTTHAADVADQEHACALTRLPSKLGCAVQGDGSRVDLYDVGVHITRHRHLSCSAGVSAHDQRTCRELSARLLDGVADHADFAVLGAQFASVANRDRVDVARAELDTPAGSDFDATGVVDANAADVGTAPRNREELRIRARLEHRHVAVVCNHKRHAARADHDAARWTHAEIDDARTNKRHAVGGLDQACIADFAADVGELEVSAVKRGIGDVACSCVERADVHDAVGADEHTRGIHNEDLPACEQLAIDLGWEVAQHAVQHPHVRVHQELHHRAVRNTERGEVDDGRL